MSPGRTLPAAALACALALGLASPAQADVVVPNANAAVEGNANNNAPFNIGSIPASPPSMRYQQVYGSSDFSGPILITGIAFRPDATFMGPGGIPIPGSGGPFGPTTFPLLLRLSTTAAPVDGLSPLFAVNVGADVTTVVSGLVTISSAFTGPASGPKDFDIIITFTTPFLYDPAGGNLLVDVVNPTPTVTRVFDAHWDPGDSISRAMAFTASAPVAQQIDSFGLITNFISTPVPEPSLAVLVLAAGGLLWRRRRSR
ncbi:MAG: PEP-CTERM sorting domain-containing protein [Planctomycetota bacterium]|jgi:hypothetical protein